ncbi:putative lipid II flippase FtsW [Patescibacteria group bacterium]|nr:putative lipid II flippase FtsW [Patescibacteria group bacterium]MDE1946516.1 cell division protein FtsW [Patescibacteria group bacterium]MDE2010923.1 cell division protein FtsW [Patescibacteria group bacterium]MDE2233322.1 cell division protein FtsW [Patescibacteria group bacterium]
MASNSLKIDRFFLASVAVLTLAGFVIFLSASLGLLAQNGASFGTIAMKQAVSLLIGAAAFFILSRVKYSFWRKTAFFVLSLAIVLNLLLFIPKLSLYHGGASRWINLGFLTFQPSEFLKIAFIIYVAAWLQHVKEKVKTLKFGLVPFVVLVAVLSILLLIQSDTDTLVIISFTGLVMFLIAGLPMKHMFLAGALLVILVAGVIVFRPYALERVKVFFDRGSDTQGAGYQINQSLIAIGSGRFVGRGFGQSIQKFGYLPQPTDDSIFAVAAEEFGFVGGIFLLALYLFFSIASFRIGARAPDTFGGMLAVGIGVLIVTESFLNMGAMLGLVPLSGVPLLFISHGGTALIITLAAAGIVANVSKYSSN